MSSRPVLSLLGLGLLAGCQLSGQALNPAAGPQTQPSVNTPVEDVSSAQAGGFGMPEPLTSATPYPLPTSEPQPNLGPRALPSGFSPQCPVGETYTPSPEPVALPTPFDPNLPPPPLSPLEVRHQHALPLTIHQSHFCDGSEQSSWYLDTTGVLTLSLAGVPPSTRRQLTPDQIAEILALLDQQQPHQWTQTNVYRCQAAELCVPIYQVQVATDKGGQYGWSERGNLVYPEIYQQTMETLMGKLNAFYHEAPLNPAQQTYRPALAVVSLDVSGKPLGNPYRLSRYGQLNGFLAPGTSADEASPQAIQLTAAELSTFHTLLQELDPVTRFQQLVPDFATAPAAQAGAETIWHFELESVAGQWDVNPTFSIYSSRIPASATGQALRSDLKALTAQLELWLRR